ncbi:MAG: hypothetical protein HY903_19705 [Deltaproteobacteria bacterium]|nr:hypothetical protein [Deltaproteobacteria bacterium]
MLRISVVCLGAVLAFACHQSPSLEGTPLGCRADTECAPNGDGWRCYKSVCIKNGRPALEALGDDVIALGAPPQAVSRTAIAADPEADVITITWTPVGGPAATLVPAPLVGDTLTITPTAVGIYEFDVVASDPYQASAPGRYRLLVQPALDAVYVSTDGVDQAGCGAIDSPCQTIGYGAEVAAGRPSQRVLVAAASGMQPYRECLDLHGDVAVGGCYDPRTWSFVADNRRLCPVECERPNPAIDPANWGGHHIDGNVTLTDLTLRLSPTVVPVANELTPDDPTDLSGLLTLWIDGGAPTVDDVDIEIVDGGHDNTGIGLGSVHASPTLTDVNVAGTVAGFDPMELLIGMVFYGGAPVLQGGGTGHAAPRGEILLNAPVTEQALGVLAAVSTLTIDSISIRGGYAPTIAGMTIIEGQNSISNLTLDLAGIGTRDIFGVAAYPCNPSGTGPDACTCKLWYPACPETEPAAPASPSLAFFNSSIRLSALGSDLGGLRPCRGIGLQTTTDRVPLVFTGDPARPDVAKARIEVGDHFTLAAGLIAGGAVAEPLRMTNTTLIVGSAATDDVCKLVAEQSGYASFDAGAIGVGLLNGIKSDLSGNSIEVGANDVMSVGLVLSDPGVANLRDNAIEVGDSQGRFTAAMAIGILTQPPDEPSGRPPVTEPSHLSGNVIRCGADATLSSAVSLNDTPYWEVDNNLIFGGGVHSAGLTFSTAAQAPDHPVLRHNTISAGGNSGTTITGRALDVYATIPVFQNNLVDAGNASGRRVALNTLAHPPFGADSIGNRVQFDDRVAGPGLAQIVPAYSIYDTDAATEEISTVQWWALGTGSSELFDVLEVGFPDPTTLSVIVNFTSMTLPGPILTSWSGPLGTAYFVVAALPDSIAMAKVEGDQMPVFEYASTESDGVVHQPSQVAAGFVNNDPFLDLIFLEAGQVWALPRTAGGSFDAPAPAGWTDGVVSAFAVDTAGDTFVALADDDVVMVTSSKTAAIGTQRARFKLPAVPRAVGPVLITSFDEELATGNFGRGTKTDVVVIADMGPGPKVFVFLNPFTSLADPSPLTFKPAAAPLPCQRDGSGMVLGVSYPDPDSLPVLSLVSELVSPSGSRGKELVLGCADGRLEVFNLTCGALLPCDSLTRSALPARVTPPAPVTGLAASQFNGTPRLIAARGGANTATTYVMQETVIPTTIEQALQITIPPDTAWRDAGWQLRPDFDAGGPLGTSVQAAATGVPRQCAFVGGAPYDLHLASAPVTECQAARLADVPVDADVGSRADPTAIGADEFGVP